MARDADHCYADVLITRENPMATNDATVNAALDEIAKKFGMTREQALKVVVSKGMQEMTSQLGAQAYASGSGIVFGAPGKNAHTAAHEATHVIQQSTRKLQTP